ncbi:adenylate kinase [Cymbomonas tetramitiformis]|uniref:Guanylate kinase 1 n=1 Tax=Cymbomonas tetramitiformis TaxID=36881 RepID=A0AAE0LD85_9CHLO|nr:adenylate kinase [Cymbomonas tetramitiformis]
MSSEREVPFGSNVKRQNDALYLKLKTTISLLSPVIRNRLRGLPAYVLDYADVIPSNSVERMNAKPVVVCGPQIRGSKAKLIEKLVDEFPGVFGSVTVHTTRKSLDEEADNAHFKSISQEEMDANISGGKFLAHYKDPAAQDPGAAVAASRAVLLAAASCLDLFAHPSLVNTYGISAEYVNEVTASDKLCILDLTLEGAEMFRKSGTDAMFIFLCPDSMENFGSRLRSSLMHTPEAIESFLKEAEQTMEAAKEYADAEVVVPITKEDDAFQELCGVISEYRPDVISKEKEPPRNMLAPVVICGPPWAGVEELATRLGAEFDSLGVPIPHTNRDQKKEDVPGEHFHFLKKDEFDRWVQEGKFLYVEDREKAQYGVAYETIDQLAGEGKICVLTMDPTNAKRAKAEEVVEAQYVFVATDHVELLEEKMREAGEKDEDKIARFLQQVKEDIEEAKKGGLYDYFLRHDPSNIESTYITLKEEVMSDIYPQVVKPFDMPLVITAPPGSGMDNVFMKLMEDFPKSFGFAVSTTTRAPRQGEVDGISFHFVDRAYFEENVPKGKFLEHTTMEGNMYGMTGLAVKQVQATGRMCIIDADIPAATQLRASGLKALYVFVEPSPDTVIRERQLALGESEDDVKKRIENAHAEMKEARATEGVYDYLLENKSFENCYARLKESIAITSPQTMPLSAVWGFGQPLYDLSCRTHGRQPLRVVLLGPALSGKTTHALTLSEQLNVPHLSTGQLLREASFELNTTLGQRAKEYLDNTEKVPDDLLLELLTLRICRPDCDTYGWLLDGFPRTVHQATAMIAAGIVPDKVIFLDCDHASLFGRAKGRRLHQETGKIYHDTLVPIPTFGEEEEDKEREAEFKAGLTIRHDDTTENVKARLVHYDANLKGLKAVFEKRSMYINAREGVENVFGAVERFIKVEDERLRESAHDSSQIIEVTPVNELTAMEYRVTESVKLKGQPLIKLRDLLAVEEKVVWVELEAFMSVVLCFIVNYRPQRFEHPFTSKHLDMDRVPPVQLLWVDSPEPTKVLVSLLVAPPEGPPTDSKRPALVLCGPSGVGKSTLIKQLMAKYPEKFGFSVSHTTRKPREGEADGVAYHFTTRADMEAQISDGQFLEHADVHGNLYGTSKEAVELVQNQNKTCILDIDVQGAKTVKDSGINAVFVFISPPNLEMLEERLRGRATETEESIEQRMSAASAEMEFSQEPGFFDRVIINNNIESAYLALLEVVLPDSEQEEARPCHLLCEQFDWTRQEPGVKELHLQATVQASVMLELPRGHHILRPILDKGFYHCLNFHSSTPILLNAAEDVMKSKEKMNTYRAQGDYPEHTAQRWGLWLRQTFLVKKPTKASVLFHVASTAATAQGRFVVINNDTGECTRYMLGRVAALELAPTKLGYTILVFARPARTLQAGKWDLLMIADNPVDAFTTCPLEGATIFSGPYDANKNAILCRYTVTGTEEQQLSLHVETSKECSFTASIYKVPPPPDPIPPGTSPTPDMLPPPPQEELVMSWQVYRIVTIPAVILPALGDPRMKYMLDVRLNAPLCTFEIAHNGDIPIQLGWTIGVASNKAMEVVRDDSRERRFAEIIASWNAKDPRARPEAAKAALKRMQQQKEEGKEVHDMSKKRKGQAIDLCPPAHHIVKCTGTDYLLQDSDYENRDSNVASAVEASQRELAEFADQRDAAHDEREMFKETKRNEFVTWRDEMAETHTSFLEQRDEYITLKESLLEMNKPDEPDPEPVAEPEPAKGKGKGKKKGEEEPPVPVDTRSKEEKERDKKREKVEKLNKLLETIKNSALSEIKSYPHPPKSTFRVLQAVLLILGKYKKEVSEWNKCRQLIDFGIITKMREYDAEQEVHKKRWSDAQKAVEGLDDELVARESVASAVLLKWVQGITLLYEASVLYKQSLEPQPPSEGTEGEVAADT